MAQEDLLNRMEFVSMLETIISSKVEKLAGCSLAIDGKWGCGKSFILKMLEANLRERGYFVVHYNCWQNDYYEEPLVAILSVLIDALNAFTASESNQEQKKEKTKRIALKLFKSISFMIVKNKLGVDFEKIGVDLDNVKNDINAALKEDGSKLLDDSFDSNQPLKTSIEIIYNQLLKIKEEWKGFVLVVDELDRCAPEYAIKVLERLHHICYDTEHDLFQFVQLVAINREELCDGISKAYGRGFIADAYPGIRSSKSYFQKTGSKSFGNYYLQKFIQMIIPVPRGRTKNTALPLLNGFEKNFVATDESYNQLVRDFVRN
jgi:KAP family P-loop domain.